MSIKKWDPQTTLNFVKMYGEHSCLWDKSNPEYKSRGARDAAIEDMIARMGIESLRIEDVKCKIRIIRNAYINEKKKIRDKKSLTVDGERKNYVCTLNWFPVADRFLSKVVRRRPFAKYADKQVYLEENEYHDSTFVSLEDENSQPSSNHSSPRSLERIDLDNLCNTNIVKIESIDDDLSENGTSEMVEAFPLSEYDTQSNVDECCEVDESNWRRMNDDVTEFVHDEAVGTSGSTISNRLAYVDEIVHGQNISEELNEFDVFAKNIALQLNRLPLENALKVQKKIHDLLLIERLSVIHQNRERENNS